MSALRILLAHLTRFHADRRGSYTLISVFGAIPFVFLVVQILNVGSVNLDRMRAQNAADALAQTHAQWTARSLNTISMNNVAMTQAATVAVGSAALHGALIELGARGTAVSGNIAAHGVKVCAPFVKKAYDLAQAAQAAAALAVTGIGAAVPAALAAAAVTAAASAVICTAEHALSSVPALVSVGYAGTMTALYTPVYGVISSNKATDALSAVNERIHERTPEEIGRILQAVARVDGADAFYVHRDCSDGLFGEECDSGDAALGMPLPADEYHPSALPEFCFQSNTRLVEALTGGLVGDTLGAGGTVLNTLGTVSAMAAGRTGYATMADRKFPGKKSPYTRGGSKKYRYVPDHIVKKTRISQFLRAFDNFYRDQPTMGVADPTGIIYIPAFSILYFPEYATDLITRSPGRGGVVGAINSVSGAINTVRGVISSNPGSGEAGAALDQGLSGGADDPTAASGGDGGIDLPDLVVGTGDEVLQILLHLREQKEPEERDNNFFSRLSFHWAILCVPLPTDALSLLEPLIGLGVPPLSRPSVFYPKDRPLPGAGLLSDGDDYIPDAFKPLVFAYHQPDLRIGSTRFFALPGRGAFAVAEGVAANPEGFDFYSQTWEGRLTPVSQLDDLGPILETMDRLAPAAFAPLRQTYKAVERAGSDVEEAVGVLHAH